MASPSSVLTLGLGSWGSVSLVTTLGFGIGEGEAPPEAAGSLLFTAYATPSIRSLASLQPSLDADAHLRPSIEGKVS